MYKVVKIALATLVIISILGLAVVGCSQSTPTPTSAPAPAPKTSPAPAPSTAPAPTSAPSPTATTEKPIVFKTSINYAATHTYSKGLKFFSDLVKERTNGVVDFKIFYSSELIPPDQEFDAVSSGAIDAAWTSAPYFGGKVRLTDVTNVPFYLYGSIQAKHSAMAEAYPLIDKAFAKSNNKNLWWMPPVYYQLLTKKLVKVPADLKGLRIRGAGGYQSEALGLWGATPVSMTVAEIYTAIQRGTVDGTAITTPSVLGLKLNEVTDNILVFDLPLSTAAMYMNLAKWNTIPDKYKKVITDAEPETFLNNDKLWWEDDAKSRATWKTAFKSFYVPTKDELKLWVDSVTSLKQKAIKDIGPDAEAFFTILDKYNGK